MGIFDGILDKVVGVVTGNGFLGDVAQSVIGGVLGQAGASQQNEYNSAAAAQQMAFQREQADRAMAFSQSETDKNRSWLENMSGTAYQRAAGDLRAAGFNPMLSLIHGGANTPTSGAPQGVVGGPGARAELLSPTLSAVNTAMAAARTRADVRRQDAETELLRAQIPKVAQEVATGASTARNYEARTKDLLDRLKLMWDVDYPKGQSEAYIASARTNVIQEQLRAAIDKLKAEGGLARAGIGLKSAEAQRERYRLVHERNQAESEENWWGSNIRPYLSDADKIVSSGAQLFRLSPAGRTSYSYGSHSNRSYNYSEYRRLP